MCREASNKCIRHNWGAKVAGIAPHASCEHIFTPKTCNGRNGGRRCSRGPSAKRSVCLCTAIGLWTFCGTHMTHLGHDNTINSPTGHDTRPLQPLLIFFIFLSYSFLNSKPRRLATASAAGICSPTLAQRAVQATTSHSERSDQPQNSG